MNRAVARAVRWIRGGRGPVSVWHHPTYRLPLPPGGKPVDPRRADDALATALDLGWLGLHEVRTPDEVALADAARAHDAAYLASLDRPEVIGAILGLDPARLSVAEWVGTWRRACGATVAGAQAVLAAGGRAVNLLGGFHHARRDAGGGNCALNDVAIAIHRVRADGYAGRITVLDLDAHPPDGIVSCVGDDPDLTVLSLSVQSEWPLPLAARARVHDVRIDRGADDRTYLPAVDGLLAEIGDPGLVFYLAGADPLDGDALGELRVSEDGLRERDRRVLRAIAQRPTVILAAGGYHPRSWRVLTHTIAEAVGWPGSIPTGTDPVRRATRLLAGRLGPPPSDDGPLLTERELLGGLGLAPAPEARFLGMYTRHGIEHVLSVYGYLGLLERMGFQGLTVEIEIRPPAADRLTIRARSGSDAPAIVDLAASIREVDGFRCLFLEWLELVDVRGGFSAERPPLPGQRKPGLGLANETLELLARAAERLSLAGIAFVAAHYHVAWMARDRLTVVDPEERGRFRAILAAMEGVPLVRATEILSTTGLHAEDGVTVRWEPLMMAAPASPELERHLREGEPRAAEVEQAWRERLLPPHVLTRRPDDRP